MFALELEELDLVDSVKSALCSIAHLRLDTSYKSWPNLFHKSSSFVLRNKFVSKSKALVDAGLLGCEELGLSTPLTGAWPVYSSDRSLACPLL